MLNILTRFSIDIAMSYASLPNCNKQSAMQQLFVNNYMVHICKSLLLVMFHYTVLKELFENIKLFVMHATVY